MWLQQLQQRKEMQIEIMNLHWIKHYLCDLEKQKSNVVR